MKIEDDDKFDLEMIYELHTIVGIDAVSEFHTMLLKEYPHRAREFRDALREYYETEYWKTMEIHDEDS